MRARRTLRAATSTHCSQVKSDGTLCDARALHGSTYCFFHDPDSAADRDAARKKGGQERSRKAAVLPPDTPDRVLATASDVTALLAETINQVRRGELDTRISNAVGYLASILLNAKERDEMERRLERLESIVAGQPSTPTLTDGLDGDAEAFEFVQSEPGSKRE